MKNAFRAPRCTRRLYWYMYVERTHTHTCAGTFQASPHVPQIFLCWFARKMKKKTFKMPFCFPFLAVCLALAFVCEISSDRWCQHTVLTHTFRHTANKLGKEEAQKKLIEFLLVFLWLIVMGIFLFWCSVYLKKNPNLTLKLENSIQDSFRFVSFGMCRNLSDARLFFVVCSVYTKWF